MRCARSSAWVKSAICAGGLLAATAGLAPGAVAQEKYQQLFVFGDSYADLTLSDQPAPNPLAPAGLGLSFWRVYPVPLASNLGIPMITDVAVGGATASPTAGDPNPLIFPPQIAPGNLPQQVGAFLATNPPFGARDLITINIGGNDIRAILGNTAAENLAGGYPPELITPFNAKTFADTTTAYAVSQIDLLVKAGAQNFVLGGFSSISQLPELQAQLALLDPAVAQIVAASADTYAEAYFDGLQTALAPYSQDGGRFFLLDLARLAQVVEADPAKYGFSGGFICPQNGLPGLAAGICGATAANPTNLNPDQELYYFGPDGLHLTNGGFKIVADYMANIVMAPDTIAVQPGLVMSTTSAFTGSVLGRLDAMRDARDRADFRASIGADGPMGLGYGGGKRARPEGPSSRLTAYSIGTFAGGSRDDTFAVSGFDYDARSGTVGLEYSASRNLIVGLAGNITNTGADLNSDADVDIDALQAAAYASYATRQVFLEGLVSYGSHDLDLSRLAVLPGDTIRSSTYASSLTAAARGGYLFDFGSLRAGPIAGLTYIRSRVDGYTEDGDDLLTFNVEGQTLESLTGNLGIQFRGVFLSGGNLVSPFLNVSLEHQFGDDARTFTSSLTQAPLLPIPTTVSNFDTRTYGRVEGGVLFGLGSQMSATVNASSTFARDEGDDWRISTGLSFRF